MWLKSDICFPWCDLWQLEGKLRKENPCYNVLVGGFISCFTLKVVLLPACFPACFLCHLLVFSPPVGCQCFHFIPLPSHSPLLCSWISVSPVTQCYLVLCLRVFRSRPNILYTLPVSALTCFSDCTGVWAQILCNDGLLRFQVSIILLICQMAWPGSSRHHDSRLQQWLWWVRIF